MLNLSLPIPPPADASSEWNYDMRSDKGPRLWNTLEYPNCDVVKNPKQSPIALRAADSFYGFDRTKPVNFIPPVGGSKNFTVKNDGNRRE